MRPSFLRIVGATIQTMLILSLHGCIENRIQKIAITMEGREIILPDNLELMNSDHISDTAWLDTDNKIRLVINIPKESCSGCRLSAKSLLDSILYILPSCEFSPVVILSEPENTEVANIEAAIASARPSYPVYIDNDGQFLKSNRFIPRDIQLLQAFLIDTSGNIILIGDPSFDYNIMKVYQKALNGMITGHEP